MSTFSDIAETSQSEQAEGGFTEDLQMIASGEDLELILNDLVRIVENQQDHLVCSILLLDHKGQRLAHTVGSTLGEEFSASAMRVLQEALDRISGSTAHGAELLFVADVSSDPLWEDVRKLSQNRGYRMSWSQPIVSSSGDILGTLVVCYRRQCQPNAAEIAIVDMAAHLAGVAIEHNRTEYELVCAKEKALAATQAKSEFLANMSHEVRTPLTAIRGFAETLLDPEVCKDERIKAVSTILRNTDHLLELLNDILDLSKIEANKLVIENVPCNLFELLTDVESAVTEKASIKGLSLIFDYQYPLPGRIVADPTRIKQVLLNLIGNAVKFTEKGEVRVSTYYHPEASFLEFSVKDTGVGMSQEQQARLFQPFSQGDSSTTRRFGGTGLGLAISRDLAERMGGNITVMSSLGQGSTFTVSIAVQESEGSELVEEYPQGALDRVSVSMPSQSPHLRGRVLVVEDGEDNQALLCYLLRKAGLEFEVAENGKEAVERTEEGNFDLILMDIQMPVMDGYTATRLIREKGHQLPIIALTASTLKQAEARCRGVGCNAYIRKPFKQPELYTVISNYLGESSERVETQNILPNVDDDLLDDSEEFDEERAEVVRNFVKNLPKRLSTIQEAHAEADWEELRMLTHRLASAGLFGFPALGSISSSIEEALKQGRYTVIASLISALMGLIEQIVSES